MCPVCGATVSDTICPYSLSGSHNGKGPGEHKTFNGRYTNPVNNPYWNVMQVRGFRMGWTSPEIRAIFSNADTEINGISRTGSGAELSMAEHRPEDVTKTFLSESMVRGLTEAEVFALCCLGIYKIRGFPEEPRNIEIGDALFGNNEDSVPPSMRLMVYDVFGTVRNTFELMKQNKPKFNLGIMRLIDRWLINDTFTEFFANSANAVTYGQWNIKPSVRKQGDKSWSLQDDDETRYARYQSAGYESSFSQLYYYGLKKTDDTLRVRAYADIDWLRKHFNQLDIFGFPAFILLKENRLRRLLFCFLILGLKVVGPGMDDEVFNHMRQLINAHTAIMPKTDDLRRRRAEVWLYNNVGTGITNDTFDGYISAFIRAGGRYEIPQRILIEAFRRMAGWGEQLDKPTGNNPISKITGLQVNANEVAKLQGGEATPGQMRVPMLNFQATLMLLTPYIRDPSPVPYSSRPRHGIIRCECGADPVFITNEFKKGCFDKLRRIDGKPVEKEPRTYDVVLSYECNTCRERHYRELTLKVTMDCEGKQVTGHSSQTSNTAVCVINRTRIKSYIFKEKALEYTVVCECGHETTYTEPYDFDTTIDPTHTIEPTGVYGPNGVALYKVVAPNGHAKYIEIPVNLKPSLESKPETGIVCPYEVVENGEDTRFSEMPYQYSIPAPIPNNKPDHVNRGEGVHTVRIVETTENNGRTVRRYECQNHKELVGIMVDNLSFDPTQNDTKIQRGDLALEQIPINGSPTNINSPSALLDADKVETTQRLMNTPLPIEESGIAQTQQELDDAVEWTGDALELRHMYTFDITEEGSSFETNRNLCREWQRMELALSTVPLERYRRKHRSKSIKKKLSKWNISESPMLIDPVRSMPLKLLEFAKKKVRRTRYHKQERSYSGATSILVDISYSMHSDTTTVLNPEGSVISCPYVRTKDECSPLSSGIPRTCTDNTDTNCYQWQYVHEPTVNSNGVKVCGKCNEELDENNQSTKSLEVTYSSLYTDPDTGRQTSQSLKKTVERKTVVCKTKSGAGRCITRLSRIMVARRVIVGIVKDAKERGDYVSCYGYTNTGAASVPFRMTRDYEKAQELAMTSTLLDPVRGNSVLDGFNALIEDIENNISMNQTTIVISDGDLHTTRGNYNENAKKTYKKMAEVLKKYGPIYIYQIAEQVIFDDDIRMHVGGTLVELKIVDSGLMDGRVQVHCPTCDKIVTLMNKHGQEFKCKCGQEGSLVVKKGARSQVIEGLLKAGWNPKKDNECAYARLTVDDSGKALLRNISSVSKKNSGI